LVFVQQKSKSPESKKKTSGRISKSRKWFVFFYFKFVPRTYDYTDDEQKMKLFPSTLKDASLSWFMGLLGDSITTWAQMQ